MKRNILKVAALSVALMMGQTASAQLDLKGAVGGLLGGSSSSSSTTSGSDLISTLTSVFSSSKQADKDKIIGTWVYSEPAIVLESDNFLSNAAYKIAANKVESKLQTYLTQYGITPGTFMMTFNEDGTCSETIKGKTVKGTWKIQDKKLILSINGIKALSVTTQIDSQSLLLVTDATKLLNMFKSFGASSTNSNIKTVASLLNGAKGMQAGLTMKKK